MYTLTSRIRLYRIVVGLVAFLGITLGAQGMDLPPGQVGGGPPPNHPSNESPGGPGWDEANNVPKSTHTRIAEGCMYKSEMVFYLTDEKRYNGGNIHKMETFMLENMASVEYRIKIKLFKYLHEWIDRYAEENMEWMAEEEPVHEVTWAFFQECMQNSYMSMSLQPVDLTRYYVEKFMELLQEVKEGEIPIDT